MVERKKKYKYSDDFLENKYFKLENSLYKDNI